MNHATRSKTLSYRVSSNYSSNPLKFKPQNQAETIMDKNQNFSTNTTFSKPSKHQGHPFGILIVIYIPKYFIYKIGASHRGYLFFTVC